MGHYFMGRLRRKIIYLFSILIIMLKKIILCAAIFVITGELLIRFDERFKLMESTQVVKISTSLEITPEFEMVKNNSINMQGNNFRVMVIGDSYIHGGGIEFSNNFSQRLKVMLKKANAGFDDVYVLDVSKASSNNFDNNQTYFQFVDKFRPQLVILGYNYNDVMGNLDKQRAAGDIENFEKLEASSSEKRTFIKKVYDFLYQSSFIQYTLSNLHTQLKARGIIFPNSAFSIILRSYYEDQPNWIKSRELLREMMNDAKQKDIQFLVLKFPEINLLEYPKLFTRTDDTLRHFFSQLPEVKYVDGLDIFKGERSKDNILSKYDGHPNERAHKKMAENIFGVIKGMKVAEGKFK
jgi:lysophospholipase L1-like esterase